MVLVTHAMCVICSQLSVNNGVLIHSPERGLQIWHEHLSTSAQMVQTAVQQSLTVQEIQVKYSFLHESMLTPAM